MEFFTRLGPSPNLTGKVSIKVAKQRQLDYHILGSSSLTAKKLRSFQIRRKIGNLAYELKLLTKMKIHPIISVIHLKQTRKNDFEKKKLISKKKKLPP